MKTDRNNSARCSSKGSGGLIHQVTVLRGYIHPLDYSDGPPEDEDSKPILAEAGS
jgi:hypothetical protein